MTLISNLLHILAPASTTALSCLGVALGQTWAAKAALEAIDRQPSAQADIRRALILGLGIIETAAILGVIGAMFLRASGPTGYLPLAELGVALALGVPCFFIGISSSGAVQSATHAIARQPFIAKNITNLMLLSQSLMQTPLVLSFVIAITIATKFPGVTTLSQALALIGSGLALAFGCIGPSLGVGSFTATTLESAGLTQRSYTKLIPFTIISQTLIETPVIFSTITAFLLTTKASKPLSLLVGVICVAIGLLAGIGTLAPGLSSSRTASAAAQQIGLQPQRSSAVMRTSLIGQGIIDTCALYVFIVSLLLILRI